MKHWLIFGLLMLLSAPAFAQESAPVIRYDSVPNALKLPPNTYFGEATGVAVNSKKHVSVLSRGNRTGPSYGTAAAQLLEFGQDGRYLREIGKHLYACAFGHTVRDANEDNFWTAD